MELTIEQKQSKIAELKAKIARIKAEPNRPYELVMITFDGHGFQSKERTEILATNDFRQKLLKICIDMYGVEPIEIPAKSLDRKYKTIYHIRPAL